MGANNWLQKVKPEIEHRLRFRILSNDESFWLAVDKAGKKRWDHVLALMDLWQKDGMTGRQKYDRLMALLRLVTPEHDGPMRNSLSEHGKQAQANMDAEALEAIRRD